MNFADFLLKELFEAYYKARTGGKRKTEDEHKFEANDFENLVRLRDSIIARTYKPSRGVAFIIHDPVTREVFAAPFPDRVVHHFVYKHTDSWWGHRLLPCSYSCRKDKGTREGIFDLQRKIRRVSQNGTKKTVVIKCDLRGYFMSIPHEKAYRRIVWGLKQQFPNGGELYHTLHPKKLKIIPIEDGVDFLGAKVYHDHILPGERISQNYANAIYKLATTGKGKPDSITSYDGHLAHFNSHKLSQKLWNGVGWDYPYPKLTPKQKQKQKNKRNKHQS